MRVYHVVRYVLGMLTDGAASSEAVIDSVLVTCNTGGCTCSVCEQELSPGEPVVRAKEPPEQRYLRYCLDHSPYPLDCLEEGECSYCARPMLVDVDFGWRAFCSESCRWTASNGRTRERRWAARAACACAVCGESLVGTRQDALYCSSGCRQQAYRARHRVKLSA